MVRMPDAQPWIDRSWTSLDGLKLHYRDYPGNAERPPLLCLHGLTRNARDFAELALRHAGRFRVLAVDFRGRGESDRDPDPSHYQPITYAADILALLDSAAIPRAIFVGTSLGGLVTMLIAGMQPQRIEAAILNDVGPDLDPRGIARIKGYVGQALTFRDWDEAADRVADMNRHLPAGFTRRDWVRAAKRVCREDNGAIGFDYDMAIAEAFNQPEPAQPFDMWPLFRALAAKPLLVVRGGESDLLTAQSADAMRASGERVELVTLPGVPHAPTLDEPAAAAAIDRFLARWD